MNDRELCNYIRANFLPEKNTAIYFDLRNYHLCGLQPMILKTPEEMESITMYNASHCDLFACTDYFEEEILYMFSYKKLFQVENLTKNKIERFWMKRSMDMEKLKEELKQLELFLKSQAS